MIAWKASQRDVPMINGPRVVIRLVGGPAHDFLLSVPLERVPPFVSFGTGHKPASYYPEPGEAAVRIYRYARDVIQLN